MTRGPPNPATSGSGRPYQSYLLQVPQPCVDTLPHPHPDRKNCPVLRVCRRHSPALTRSLISGRTIYPANSSIFVMDPNQPHQGSQPPHATLPEEAHVGNAANVEIAGIAYAHTHYVAKSLEEGAKG